MAEMDTAQVTRKIQDYILQMPSLPTTATKVMQVCNTATPSPNDLNRVISLDPVLTGKVLQLINSAYYVRRNKVTSLTRAIIILGINTIKNIVLSSAIVKCMDTAAKSAAMDMDQFWSHSIHVGVAARLIAKAMKIPTREQEFYFLAGLMHDLGKIPLSSQFPKQYEHSVNQAGHGDICEVEERLIGLNHCHTGRMIAEKWKLGDEIGEALTFHHDYRSQKSIQGHHVSIIELADLYANYDPPDTEAERWAASSHELPPRLPELLEETAHLHRGPVSVRCHHIH